MTDVFATLKYMNSTLSEFYWKQEGIIKDRVCRFFKYYREELESLKDVFSHGTQPIAVLDTGTNWRRLPEARGVPGPAQG